MKSLSASRWRLKSSRRSITCLIFSSPGTLPRMRDPKDIFMSDEEVGRIASSRICCALRTLIRSNWTSILSVSLTCTARIHRILTLTFRGRIAMILCVICLNVIHIPHGSVPTIPFSIGRLFGSWERSLVYRNRKSIP